MSAYVEAAKSLKPSASLRIVYPKSALVPIAIGAQPSVLSAGGPAESRLAVVNRPNRPIDGSRAIGGAFVGKSKQPIRILFKNIDVK